MRAGIIVYGLASAACGIMDLMWGDFDASHQPIQAFGDHIPGVAILAYLTAIWMIAEVWQSCSAAALAPVERHWRSSISCSPYSGCLDYIRRPTISGFGFPSLSA